MFTTEELIQAMPEQLKLIHHLNEVVAASELAPQFRAHAIHAVLSRQVSLIPDQKERTNLLAALAVTLDMAVQQYLDVARVTPAH